MSERIGPAADPAAGRPALVARLRSELAGIAGDVNAAHLEDVILALQPTSALDANRLLGAAKDGKRPDPRDAKVWNVGRAGRWCARVRVRVCGWV